MKKMIAVFMLLAACGYSSSDNEAVGQVKKVLKKTPIICPDYFEVDVSLGVMRNGVGSLSKEDIFFAVDPADAEWVGVLKKAADDGSIVKVGYNVERISPCWPDHRLFSVEVEAVPTPSPSAQ